MKRLLLILLLGVLSPRDINAQYLNTIFQCDLPGCEMTKAESDHVHIAIDREEQIDTKPLSKTKLETHVKNVCSAERVFLANTSNVAMPNRLGIDVYGGWSYMVGRVSDNVPTELRDYIKGVKSGYHYGVNIGYFLLENVGVGLRYTNFRSINELDNIYIADERTSEVLYGRLKDDISVQFIAPRVYARASIAKKIDFFSAISIGYLSYKNRATLVHDFTLSSGTVGLGLDAGVDFRLNKSLAFFVGGSYLMGVLTKIESDNGISKQTIRGCLYVTYLPGHFLQRFPFLYFLQHFLKSQQQEKIANLFCSLSTEAV